jgi:hypothetical protein
MGDGGTGAEGVEDRSRRAPATVKGVGDYEGCRVVVASERLAAVVGKQRAAAVICKEYCEEMASGCWSVRFG